MKQRFLRVLPVLFVCSIAVVVFADRKTASVVMKLVRLEGKDAGVEVFFNPAEITITKSNSWTKKGADSSNADEPELEFTAADPAELSCDLMFDLFEEKQNVYLKEIQPLENLMVVDKTLKRPPMVRITFDPPNASSTFQGVVSSLQTKYTMFLADGTPVRATATVKLKQAGRLSVGKNPCP